VAWGPGWDHANVCHGDDIKTEPGRVITDAGKNRSIAIAFFRSGAPLASCKVRLFSKPNSDDDYVAYEVTEKTYDVVDSYTGKTHTVRGLAGAWASRPGSRPTTKNDYCLANSKGTDAKGRDVKDALCFGNLAPAGGADDLPVNTSFVSVDNHCSGDGRE